MGVLKGGAVYVGVFFFLVTCVVGFAPDPGPQALIILIYTLSGLLRITSKIGCSRISPSDLSHYDMIHKHINMSFSTVTWVSTCDTCAGCSAIDLS